MTAPSLAESYVYCCNLTRKTAHNFRFSFLTLPRAERSAMEALYAFNRITDDLGDDESVPITQRQMNLSAWRDAVQDALKDGAGNPLASCRPAEPLCGADPGNFTSRQALPAITDMVRRYGIPHEHLFEVIDGVEWDLRPIEIATFTDLERYCYHVAGAVGLCCIRVWGFRDDPAVRPLAIECGLALQLTNILRDLAEDADRGRIYLPREDLDRFGYSADDLRRHVINDRFRDLMKFETDRARGCYERGEQLFAHLEPRGKPILRAMLDIYRGLLDEIVRRDFDVFTKRVSLPKSRKLWLAVRAMLQHWMGQA